MKKAIIYLVASCILLLAPGITVNAETAETDFLSALDGHGLVMLFIDPATGDIIYANQAAVSYYGYSKEHLTSMKITDINALGPEETVARMEEAAQKQRNYFEFEHRLSSGEIRIVEVYSYPYQIADRELLFSVIHDVTAEKALEKSNQAYVIALAASSALIVVTSLLFTVLVSRKNRRLKAKAREIARLNELRRMFIDYDRRMIYLKDENLKYIFVNNTLAEYFGIEPGQVVGRDDFDIMENGLAEKNTATDRQVLHEQATVVSEIKWKERIFKLTKFPILESNGSYGVGAYVEDITESEKAREAESKTALRNAILVDVFTRDFNSTHQQLDYVLSQALKLTDSKFGYIYLYDEHKKEFLLNTWSEGVMDECAVLEKQTRYQLEKTGLWGEAVRQRKAIVDNNFEIPGEMKKGYPKGHVQLKRFMTVPVVIEGTIVAVVGLANKEEPYNENEVNQVTILMAGVWNALERREGKEQLQLILDSTAEAIYGLDKEGKCTFINTAGLKLLGYAKQEELLGHDMHSAIHHSYRDGTKMPVEDCQIYRSFLEGRGSSNNTEVFWKKDGAALEVEYYSYPQIRDGMIIGGVVTFLDNTKRKADEEKIIYLSYRDPLTGLYNRRFFEDEMGRVDSEDNLPIAIIMGDLNGLKMTNDIFGHSVGDELLEKAASAIKKSCRDSDVVARVGGDEFAIILARSDSLNTEKVIRRIKETLSKQKINAVKGSISMGYALKEKPEEKLESTMEAAEDAMYRDKALNRDKVNTELLRTIIDTLHSKSSYEKTHSEQMYELCEKLGIQLQLPEADIKKLREAGYLHDIGKIVLEPEWLNPESDYDDEVKKEIENHPVASYRILNLFDETMEIAGIVLNHHEYLDGSGYPNNKAGNEIPLLSRILNVAEDFLTLNNGSGSTPVNYSKALNLIKKQAGIKYDSSAVSALLDLYSNL
ncbi:MAG: diguanylate cyclase [Dehalococcoidales bacterium]|nr:diguanylate cyclase [Dehalococcoidales bacterium]MDD4322192.1 diguanylate cyclase [Dehalococcoidales bacterium]MDD4794199.1 diguanylate cyclase [Dehalococcoidales bacterium]MDD5121867.1 diguanylate cyclase [Dehalococcoidales bacterium]MDD5498437.1 diguanylate cyclase [Dehalococcoidales bacterium]